MLDFSGFIGKKEVNLVIRIVSNKFDSHNGDHFLGQTRECHIVIHIYSNLSSGGSQKKQCLVAVRNMGSDSGIGLYMEFDLGAL